MKKKPAFFNKISSFLSPSPVITDLASYEKILQIVNSFGPKYSEMTDLKLKNETGRFKADIASGKELKIIVPDFFAFVREVCHRQIGLRPYDVQILAALALQSGNLIEMATGEGKTLAAVLPACLNGLAGRGVHVLTFNDYLAERDSQWMGPVYKFIGLKVAYVNQDMNPDDRKEAWHADVTYATAKQAGFDYLRDCAGKSPEGGMHQPFHFAIIDEADALLIDEARNPFILAEQVLENIPDRMRISDFISRLVEGEDYSSDENGLNAVLTEKGIRKTENEFKVLNIHADENYGLLTAVHCALHARVLLHRDVDYIVREGRILIVDEFTGRIVEDRQWQNGLQTAVEAKEGLKSVSEGKIIGSLAPQFFIKLYPRIAAMTGTAKSAADEFKSVYGLDTVVIPTNKPCLRKDMPESVFPDMKSKIQAVINSVRTMHELGRPVLIGTRTVSESEELSQKFKVSGIECVVLNAKNDKLEASIIADAGRIGAVTISTNMAGRGTDILLGGSDGRNREKVAGLGGLHVIGTNRHESRRIDDQLKGRAGRQGDPGSSQFFISSEDDLWTRHGLKDMIADSVNKVKMTGGPHYSRVSKEISHAQKVLEGKSREMRRTLFDYSFFMEKQRQVFLRMKNEIMENIAETDKEQAGGVGIKLNDLWSGHLSFSMDLREGIHLVRIGGGDPLREWQKKLDGHFRLIIERLENWFVGNNDSAGLKMVKVNPGSTWTYILNDDPFDGRMDLLDSSKVGFQIDVPSMLLLSAARKVAGKKSHLP